MVDWWWCVLSFVTSRFGKNNRLVLSTFITTGAGVGSTKVDLFDSNVLLVEDISGRPTKSLKWPAKYRIYATKWSHFWSLTIKNNGNVKKPLKSLWNEFSEMEFSFQRPFWNASSMSETSLEWKFHFRELISGISKFEPLFKQNVDNFA